MFAIQRIWSQENTVPVVSYFAFPFHFKYRYIKKTFKNFLVSIGLLQSHWIKNWHSSLSLYLTIQTRSVVILNTLWNVTWQKESADKLVRKVQGLTKPSDKDCNDKGVKGSLYQHQGERNTHEQLAVLLEDMSNVT